MKRNLLLILTLLLWTGAVWADTKITSVSIASNPDPGTTGTNPDYAIDGDEGTAYVSNNAGATQITFDFGSQKKVSKVVIKWTEAYGKGFDLHLGDTENNVNGMPTIYSQRGTALDNPYEQTINIAGTNKGRYLSLFACETAAEQSTYGIKEIEFYEADAKVITDINGITVEPTTISVGGTATITAIDQDDEAIDPSLLTYTVNTSAAGSVNADGIFTAAAAGSTTITAALTSNQEINATSSAVTINEAVLTSFTMPKYIFKAKTGQNFNTTVKDAEGNNFTGAITYTIEAISGDANVSTLGANITGNNIVFGAAGNAGVYQITATDANSNSISHKFALVDVAPEVPTLSSSMVVPIYSETYDATAPNYSDAGWNWKYSSKDELDFNDNKVLRVHEVGTIGFKKAYKNENVVSLEFDIYTAENTDGYVVLERSGLSNKIFTTTGGEWKHVSLDIEGYDAAAIDDEDWIQIYVGGSSSDNQRDVLIDNVYLKKEVTAPYLKAITADATATTVTLGNTATITAQAKDQFNENYNDVTYSYSSADTGVASVNAEGVVTANALGSATITVTATDEASNSKSTTIDFTVVLPEPTAPEDLQGNVAVIFSSQYGLGTSIDDLNSGYGKNDVPTDPIFTAYAYPEMENGHKVLKITGAGANGRVRDPNNEGAAVSAGTFTAAKVAIWPTTATKVYIFGDNEYATKKSEFSLTPGRWNYVVVPNPTATNYMLVYLTQEDGTAETEFYLDHWYVAKDMVAPTLVTASLSAYDAVSATIKVTATDDVADPVTIKVNANDGDSFNKDYETTVAKDVEGTYKVTGLLPGKTYTITVKANDGVSDSENSASFNVTTSSLEPALTPTTTTGVFNIYCDELRDNHSYAEKINATPVIEMTNAAADVTATYSEITMRETPVNKAFIVNGANKFVINHGGNDAQHDSKLYEVANIVFFVTGDVSTLKLTPLFYAKKGDGIEKSFTVNVTPNQWNYLTFKTADYVPNEYTGKDLYALKVEGMNGNAIFFDNFYYATNSDITAPVFDSATGAPNGLKQADGSTDALVAVVAKPYEAEFTVKAHDEVSRVIKYDFGILGPTLESEANSDRWYGETVGIYEGAGVSNAQDVKFYMNNLRPNSDYTVTVYATDEAANQSSTTVVFHTAALEQVELQAIGAMDNGKICLKGWWNADRFNNIDLANGASCYDLSEVDFITEDKAEGIGERLDKGTWHTFNPNAIIVSPILNKFNTNYVMRNPDGSYTGFNIVYHDGDWKPEDYITDGTWRRELTTDQLATLTEKGAIDRQGYMVVGPYTGFEKITSQDNFAYTRQISGSSKYATVVFPFVCNASNLETGLKLYQLSTVSGTPTDEGGIKLSFTEVTGTTTANTPYLVESTNGGGTIDFIDSNLPKTISFPTGTDFSKMKSLEANDLYLFGTYNLLDVQKTDNIYLIPSKDNTDLTLYRFETGLVPPFRAVVKYTGNSSTKLSIVFEETTEDENGETTRVERIATDEEVNAILGNVYSINGQLVRQNADRQDAFIGLPAGIYIVNGKKVIVK